VVGNEAVESAWGGDAGLVEGKADGAGRFLGDGDQMWGQGVLEGMAFEVQCGKQKLVHTRGGVFAVEGEPARVTQSAVGGAEQEVLVVVHPEGIGGITGEVEAKGWVALVEVAGKGCEGGVVVAGASEEEA